MLSGEEHVHLRGQSVQCGLGIRAVNDDVGDGGGQLAVYVGPGGYGRAFAVVMASRKGA